MISQKLRIRGRVQGVGYRDALRQEASLRAIAGWVRNRSDGSVEALVQGSSESVAELIAWARRGPPAARVEGIEIHSAESEPAHAGFEVLPSA